MIDRSTISRLVSRSVLSKLVGVTTTLLLLPLLSVAAQTGRDDRVDSTGSASPDAPASDSIFLSPEVVVYADNSPMARAFESTSAISIIGQEEIASSGGENVADLIGLAPGAYVRRYGAGGLSTVSIRGSSSAQVAMLLDGAPLRSTALSEYDLGKIPLHGLSEVSVARGSSGTEYGANALGGAVALRSRYDYPGRLLQMEAGVGSFGERRVSLSAAAPVGGGGLASTVALSSSEGTYPTDVDEFGAVRTVTRTNAAHRRAFGRLTWATPLGSGSVATTVHGLISDRGIPGAVVQGRLEDTDARLEESDLLGISSWGFVVGEFTAEIVGSIHHRSLDYHDSTASRFRDNRWELSEGFGAVRLSRGVGEHLILKAGLEGEHHLLDGDNYSPVSSDRPVRSRLGGVLRGALQLPISGGGEVVLEGGSRLDYFSDAPAGVAPSIAVSVVPAKSNIRLRAQVGRTYRVPTFSELYFLNYGNENLKPEIGTSVTAGLAWRPVSSILLDVHGWLAETENLIVSIPRSPVSWSAMNIGRTTGRGIETSIFGTLIEDRLSGRMSWSLSRSVDRTDGSVYGHDLPYTPEETITSSMTYDAGKFRLRTHLESASHRYPFRVNREEDALPRYTLLDLAAIVPTSIIGTEFELTFEVSNLLDERYQIIRGYPMPGRSFDISLSATLRD